MLTEDTGQSLNKYGVPVGWVVLNLRELNQAGSPGQIAVHAADIHTVRRQGGGTIINEYGIRPLLAHENLEEVFRRLAASVIPEVKEPVKVPAVTPASPVSDGTVPLKKKANDRRP